MMPAPLALTGSGVNTVKLGSETLRSMTVSGPKTVGLQKVISGPTQGRLLGGPSGQSRITVFSSFGSFANEIICNLPHRLAILRGDPLAQPLSH
jgi:hypothetical protein